MHGASCLLPYVHCPLCGPAHTWISWPGRTSAWLCALPERPSSQWMTGETLWVFGTPGEAGPPTCRWWTYTSPPPFSPSSWGSCALGDRPVAGAVPPAPPPTLPAHQLPAQGTPDPNHEPLHPLYHPPTTHSPPPTLPRGAGFGRLTPILVLPHDQDGLCRLFGAPHTPTHD